ncbi:MAG: cytidine deaminase [Actinomycetota bacterium]|nr:cytidine deaminase [Actinomycetota bacterium]
MSRPPRLSGRQVRIIVSPSDYERSVAYYTSGLGLVPLERFADGTGMLVELGPSGALLELLADGGPPPQGLRLALEVDDLDATLARLGEHAAGLAPVERPWGHRNVMLADPDGIELTLFEVTSAQLHVDWDQLLASATAAAADAYAPYSKLSVGAAALTDAGAIVSGCNIENASYGLTLCAECSMLGDLRRRGGGRLVAFVSVDGNGSPLAPCGRCRQLLWEHRTPDLMVYTANGPMTMVDFFPGAFGPEDLPPT